MLLIYDLRENAGNGRSRRRDRVVEDHRGRCFVTSHSSISPTDAQQEILVTTFLPDKQFIDGVVRCCCYSGSVDMDGE